MIIYKAYKFRLNPTKEQIILLNKNFGSSRFIYNYYLDKKQNIYKKENKNYLLSDMKKDLRIRKWTCEKCGNENDRDINASENILFEGLKIYMKNKLNY